MEYEILVLRMVGYISRGRTRQRYMDSIKKNFYGNIFIFSQHDASLTMLEELESRCHRCRLGSYMTRRHMLRLMCMCMCIFICICIYVCASIYMCTCMYILYYVYYILFNIFVYFLLFLLVLNIEN